MQENLICFKKKPIYFQIIGFQDICNNNYHVSKAYGSDLRGNVGGDRRLDRNARNNRKVHSEWDISPVTCVFLFKNKTNDKCFL